jgi:hypothetical protein
VEIIKTQKQDTKLLSFNLFNKERMLVRLKTKQGEDIESRIIVGSKSGVSSKDQIVQVIKDLLYRALKKQLLVCEIQIVHTHQNHKIQKNNWQVGEFSHTDLHTMSYLKTIFPYPLHLLIVSKFGASMSKRF